LKSVSVAFCLPMHIYNRFAITERSDDMTSLSSASSFDDEDFLMVLAMQEGCLAEIGKDSQEKGCGGGSRGSVPKIGLEELSRLFELPAIIAARRLNIGVTVFKKICRKHNISSWPYRRLNSLREFRHSVEEALCAYKSQEHLEGEEQCNQVISRIDEEIIALRSDPNKRIDDDLLRLRQCFYKRKWMERQKRAFLQDEPNMEGSRKKPRVSQHDDGELVTNEHAMQLLDLLGGDDEFLMFLVQQNDGIAEFI